MGFFSKDASTPSYNPLAPLSLDRVAKVLEDDELKYCYDEDGDLACGWDTGIFFFMRGGEQGEILRIQGRFHLPLPADELPKAMQACNDWNTRALWPKTFAALNNADQTVVMAEHNVDFELGATDEQIALAVHCAMTTGLRFFDHLTTEIFPEEWKVFEAEQAEREALGE